MKTGIRINDVFVALALAACLLVAFLNPPVESAARRYQYHVVSVTGMKELRTQSDADQGRMKAIETLINEQAEQGWEFYQADGYVLYFRR